MGETTPIAPTFLGRIREVITDSLAYWERKRIAYNVVLALIVIRIFRGGMAWLKSYDYFEWASFSIHPHRPSEHRLLRGLTR